MRHFYCNVQLTVQSIVVIPTIVSDDPFVSSIASDMADQMAVLGNVWDAL